MLDSAQLETLKRLRDSGAISEREYDQQKSRALGNRPDWLSWAGLLAVFVAGMAVGGLGTFGVLKGAPSRPSAVAPQPQSRPATAINAAATNATAPTTSQSRLGRVFTSEMLGARIPYLEAMVGPAVSTLNDTRSYKIEGCAVDVGTRGEDIISLRMRLGPNCSFDLDAFLPNLHLGQANRLKFRDLGRGEITADCLSDCGNAYDPAVYLTVEGSHADNFHTIVAETTDANDAVFKWAQSMAQTKGEDWVTGKKFNCDHTFDPIGLRAIAALPVQSITVGFPPDRDCPKG